MESCAFARINNVTHRAIAVNRKAPTEAEAHPLGLGICCVRLANPLYRADPVAAEPGTEYSHKKRKARPFLR